jgi:hypothetical protein
VLTNTHVPSDFALAAHTSVPLVDLKSSPTGAAFATLEATEGNYLNNDGDKTDQVVQFLDVASGMSSSSFMAASLLNNPIVGTAAVATAGNLAAFIQSEAQENLGAPNGTDLYPNGQTTDDILRVFTLQGVNLTPNPPTRLASLFPAINRNPVAVDGNLVYYRTPDVRLGFPVDAVTAEHLAVSQDGRYFVTSTSFGCGALGLQKRDGASGLPRGPADSFGDCSMTKVSAAASPSGTLPLLRNHPGWDHRGQDVALRRRFRRCHPCRRPALGAEVRHGHRSPGDSRSDPRPGGVTNLALAVSPTTESHPGGTGRRVSLYAISLTHALTAYDVSQDLTKYDVASIPGQPLPSPSLVFSQTLRDDPACPPYTTPTPNLTCIGPMVDARSLVVSPDSKFVYVAAHANGAVGVIKTFERRNGSPNLDERADIFIYAPLDVAVSPDGAQLYAIAGAAVFNSCSPFPSPCYNLMTFNRDASTGALTFAGANGIDTNAFKLVVSPDGKALHVVHHVSPSQINFSA